VGDVGLSSYSIKGSFIGKNAVIKALLSQGRRGEDAVMAAIYEIAQLTAANAVKRAPKDLGFLRSSVYVAPPTSVDLTCEIGFGVSYAAAVHERPATRSTPGTEDHFLERAIDDVVSLQAITQSAEKFFANGVNVSDIQKTQPRTPDAQADENAKIAQAARAEKQRKAKSGGKK
jgi:hypothetical protein